MTTPKDPLAALRRRLEKAELEHLRRHASDLANRLEKMEERAIRAEDEANWYWQSQQDLIQSLTDQGETLGMTANGHIGIIAEASPDKPSPEPTPEPDEPSPEPSPEPEPTPESQMEVLS